MPEFDAKEFVAKMDRMGVKLTTVPLAGGKYRVNRWRLPQAVEKAEQIESLWNLHIGDDQARTDAVDKDSPSAAGATKGDRAGSRIDVVPPDEGYAGRPSRAIKRPSIANSLKGRPRLPSVTAHTSVATCGSAGTVTRNAVGSSISSKGFPRPSPNVSVHNAVGTPSTNGIVTRDAVGVASVNGSAIGVPVNRQSANSAQTTTGASRTNAVRSVGRIAYGSSSVGGSANNSSGINGTTIRRM